MKKLKKSAKGAEITTVKVGGEVDYKDANRAFEELKTVLGDVKKLKLGETKEKIEKIEKALDKYEETNQTLVKKLTVARNARLALKERIEGVERQLSRPAAGGSKNKEQLVEMKKALDIFLRKDEKQKSSDDMTLERKYLRTDNDPSGGYLTPPEYYTEITKKITEISPIRSVARILRTSRESVLLPVRETLVLGNWVGEGVTFPASNSTYGQRELKVNMLSVSSVVTTAMVQDSVFNIESLINEDISESFAQTEGQAFVAGNGVAKPEGIISTAGLATGIQVVASGIANNFDADSLIDITGQLKVGYNPSYMFNRKTLTNIRKFKDGLGQYLWTPGIANGAPATINGYNYINAIDVPDIAANAYAVIFGDFYRGYTIVDHINMYLIRDPYTLSSQGKIQFNAIRRVGGMVILAEAIKVLKCSVS